ncbi:glycosyltransferase family 2 protein [candidate division KSB1 bacterium]
MIIPTRNRLNSLRKAVKSVLEQTFQDFEILIIDDGSTDETFERMCKRRYPVRYYYQPHFGVSAARNRGIGLAKGGYIAMLDSDDTWMPEKLDKQVRFLNDNPDVLICQTEEIWIRNGTQVNPGKRHEKPSGAIFDKSLDLCVVSPSSVMMRTQFFDEVGLFDEKLPACEDYDLWLRAAYRIEIPLIREYLTVKYGGHDDQLSRRHWGMDRFRVYSLQKLLAHPLRDDQRRKVIDEIRKKCAVLLNGAVKRARYYYAFKVMMTRLLPSFKWGILK